MSPVSRGTSSAYLSKLFQLCGPSRQVTPFWDLRMFFTHPSPLRRRVLPFLSLSYDPLSLQNLASHNLIQQRPAVSGCNDSENGVLFLTLDGTQCQKAISSYDSFSFVYLKETFPVYNCLRIAASFEALFEFHKALF